MEPQLFLDNTQLYPDTSQTIKLTRENPYFTQSDSYTLDVTLPMDVLQNRMFFQNLHRKEHTKHKQTYSCRLMVDGEAVLTGTATITQVTQEAVKVQLLGGNSEVNFLSSDNKTYIDEMAMGTYTGSLDIRNGYVESTVGGVRMIPIIVYDETSDTANVALQLRLVDVAKKIIELSGWTLEYNFADRLPWNRIYVANAKHTRTVADMLPHWLVKDFFKEFCQFFNATVITNQSAKTVRIVSNIGLYGGSSVAQGITDISTTEVIDPVDEYMTEVSSDEDTETGSMANDTLEYDLSGSMHHAQDRLELQVRLSAPRRTYLSYAAALTAWEEETPATRRKYIYECPAGLFASWIYDCQAFLDVGDEEEEGEGKVIEVFEKLDHCADLERTDGETRELKIVPVAIGWITEHIENEGATYDTWRLSPSMESPTGQSYSSYSNGSSRRAPRRAGEGSAVGDVTIQEYVEGEEDAETTGEKEDRLQVMFIDMTEQIITAEYSSVRGYSVYTGVTGFTDWQYKKAPDEAGDDETPGPPPHGDGEGEAEAEEEGEEEESHVSEEHEHWSLSLNPTDADYYLGQLHQNPYSFNVSAKHTFKFISNTMPDPTSIFLIRNKRYACEKIEASVTADGFDRLMTGYFYEMNQESLSSGGSGYGEAIEETWE